MAKKNKNKEEIPTIASSSMKTSKYPDAGPESPASYIEEFIEDPTTEFPDDKDMDWHTQALETVENIIRQKEESFQRQKQRYPLITRFERYKQEMDQFKSSFERRGSTLDNDTGFFAVVLTLGPLRAMRLRKIKDYLNTNGKAYQTQITPIATEHEIEMRPLNALKENIGDGIRGLEFIAKAERKAEDISRGDVNSLCNEINRISKFIVETLDKTTDVTAIDNIVSDFAVLNKVLHGLDADKIGERDKEKIESALGEALKNIKALTDDPLVKYNITALIEPHWQKVHGFDKFPEAKDFDEVLMFMSSGQRALQGMTVDEQEKLKQVVAGLSGGEILALRKYITKVNVAHELEARLIHGSSISLDESSLASSSTGTHITLSDNDDDIILSHSPDKVETSFKSQEKGMSTSTPTEEVPDTPAAQINLETSAEAKGPEVITTSKGPDTTTETKGPERTTTSKGPDSSAEATGPDKPAKNREIINRRKSLENLGPSVLQRTQTYLKNVEKANNPSDKKESEPKKPKP